MSKAEQFWDKQAERFAQEGDGEDKTFNTAVSLTQPYLKEPKIYAPHVKRSFTKDV